MTDKKNNALPKREEIDGRYKWKIEDIYRDDKDWEEDFKKAGLLSADLAGYKGTLGGSAERLLECLKLRDDVFSLNDRLFVYAKMKRDENNGNPEYQALTDRAMALGIEAYAAASFIVPEIISISEDVLKGYLSDNQELQAYEFFIDELLRQKPHILSEREEKILAFSEEMANAPVDIFTMFNNADIKFPYIKDENGDEVELTKGRYIKFLESRDRKVREAAFHAMYKTYTGMKNTLASMLNNSVKKDKFYAVVRKYESCLRASLDADNIPDEVYDNLIDSVDKNLHLLKRYLKLREKALKLDELHMYDLYVPMVKEPASNIKYEEALETVKEGLRPLGKDYAADLEKALGAGWIDVFENKGKTGGAYSWGAYTTHPYVLLNYQGTINDVFTIAHEMGHAMHTFYTNKTQPYIYSEYKIFVAEVASTVNESLLMRHMLNNTRDPAGKAYLLNHYLEEFRGTLFRQTMFAEFEKAVHSAADAGEALTAQEFCNVYRKLNEKYFSPEVVIDSDIDMEWARIPHFYSDFYVYKYATGMSAAVSLARQILEEGAPAVSRYMGFLSSGGSDYPLNLLKKAGVDLSTPKPVTDAMHVFEGILDELEELV